MGKIFSKIKELTKNGLLHIFVGSFMTKAISFFGSIFLVNALSKFDYGVLGYLENMYSYAWVLAGMGMANVILRYVVLGKTPEEKKGYFKYAIKFGTGWNVALMIVLGVINIFFPHRDEYASYSWLLYILAFSLPFQYICECVISNERAMFANRRYMLMSVAISFAFVASKVLLGHVWGVSGAVWGHVVTYVSLAALLYFLTVKKYYGRTLPCRELSENKHEINTYAFQYMITNGLWAIFMLNDTFLLGRYVSPELLADYKVAYTIPGCVSLISSSIGIFVAPYFVKNENNNSWIRKYYNTTMLASIGVVGAVCLGIGLLSRPIVLWLYGEEYLSVIPIMRLLLVAAFMNCGLRYSTANALAAMGKVKYNMIISAIGMLLQIGLDIWVIPRYQLSGVAYISCFVYLFMAVSLFVVFRRLYFKVDVE